MPTCYILRGLPGSGKTTLAKTLQEVHGYDASIVSADTYFVNSKGEYKFNRNDIVRAHEACFSYFKKSLSIKESVIVDNTNTSLREYAHYVDAAKKKGYEVVVLTVNTDLTDEELAKRNIHGVPVETIKRMRIRLNSNQ